MLKLKPRKTIEEFMALPEGSMAELLEGEIFMTPSPRSPHQMTVWTLGRLMGNHVEAKALGVVAGAPWDVHLPSGDVVEPDLLFVRSANRSIIQEWIKGVPDLLVEVISPDRPERDRIVKRDVYARNGVPEYWIVDPETKTVEVFRLEAGSYGRPALFEAADALTSPLLPGLSLPVSSIFPTI